MAAWKIMFLAVKLRRGWSRIPPKQRRKLVEGARDQVRQRGPVVIKSVRERGPVVAQRVRETVKNARKKR
jgi:hypothetical protein